MTNENCKSLILLLKKFFNFLYCEVIIRFKTAFGRSQYLRNLGVGHVVEIA